MVAVGGVGCVHRGLGWLGISLVGVSYVDLVVFPTPRSLVPLLDLTVHKTVLKGHNQFIC